MLKHTVTRSSNKMTAEYHNKVGKPLPGLHAATAAKKSPAPSPKLGRYDVPNTPGRHSSGQVIRKETAKHLTSDSNPKSSAESSPYKKANVYYNYRKQKGTSGTEHEPTYHTVTADYHGHLEDDDDVYDDTAAPDGGSSTTSGHADAEAYEDVLDENQNRLKDTGTNTTSSLKQNASAQDRAYEQLREQGRYDMLRDKPKLVYDDKKKTVRSKS